jgi:hypothetical protein
MKVSIHVRQSQVYNHKDYIAHLDIIHKHVGLHHSNIPEGVGIWNMHRGLTRGVTMATGS